MSAIPALGLARGAERLGTESAFSVLARAKELERRGKDIIHLEIGEPDFDTPAHIVESAVAALRSGATRYCAAAGLRELREVAAEHIAATRDINARRKPSADRHWRKAISVFRRPRHLRTRRRGRVSGSWLSDLRVGDPLCRRHADPAPPP